MERDVGHRRRNCLEFTVIWNHHQISLGWWNVWDMHIGNSECSSENLKWRPFVRPRRIWERRTTDIASLSNGAFTRSVVRCRVSMWFHRRAPYEHKLTPCTMDKQNSKWDSELNWTQVVRLRTKSSRRLLWTHKWTFLLPTWRDICWLDTRISASQSDFQQATFRKQSITVLGTFTIRNAVTTR